MKNQPVVHWIRQTVIQGLIVTFFGLVLIWAIGWFTELHPDAYRDGLRSILALFVLFRIGVPVGRKGLLALGKARGGGTKGQQTDSGQETDGWSWTESVALTFTLITLISSAMMITGLDTPKTGPFAYGHILVRLAIVVGVISLWKWRDVLTAIRRRTGSLFPDRGKPVRMTSVLYTILVILYCVLGLLPVGPVEALGGAPFYRNLLLLIVPAALGAAWLRHKAAR